jgi:hypothetical protein
LDAIARRIIRHISVSFGPVSEAELKRISAASDDDIFPFRAKKGEWCMGFEAKRAELVKKIAVFFLREWLKIDLDHLKL